MKDSLDKKKFHSWIAKTHVICGQKQLQPTKDKAITNLSEQDFVPPILTKG
jgi:hypothetical protein